MMGGIPINLELSASVSFIHKEFVTMHGHTILIFKDDSFEYDRERFCYGYSPTYEQDTFCNRRSLDKIWNEVKYIQEAEGN
jgi:hypothetical protein